MANKKIRSQSVLLPGKQWFYRASVVMMVTCAMALMVMSKTNNPAVTKLRTHVMDAVTPLLSVASRPMDTFHSFGTWLGEMSRLREENVALKNENVELLKWQAQAKALEAENKSLHALLNVVPSQKSSYITARVVSDLGGPYIHSALINGGNFYQLENTGDGPMILMGHRSGAQETTKIIDYKTRKDIRAEGREPVVHSRAQATE